MKNTTRKGYNVFEGDIMKKVDKKTAFGGGIGLAGLSQLSRNKRIRGAGGLILFTVILGGIGEVLGWILKWVIWKPCVFLATNIAKGFYKLSYWTFKIIFYYPVIYGCKEIIKFYKNKQEKTIE